MTNITVSTSTSYGVLPKLKELLKPFTDLKIRKAEFRYDTIKGVPQESEVELFPLTLIGNCATDDVTIKI